MNKLYFILFTLFALNANSQINFNNYFENQTLRMDYLHAGNATINNIYFQQLKKEPFWGGSQTNLIDTFNYGNYKVELFDKKTNKLIYSRGFNTLFSEWQTTAEAKKLNRAFYEVVVTPFPKNNAIIKISKRDKKHNFHLKFEYEIDPNNYFIKEETYNLYKSEKILDGGEPKNKVDIVLLPEGYSESEMDKFKKDAKRFESYIFEYSPFKENKDKFNIWTVNAPSVESGTDIPGKHIWKNTILNSTFYTFDSERYLTTQDMKSTHDVAAYVPYDQIFIIVNTKKYGGGGIFNFYNLSSIDHSLSKQVIVHEFGHGFAGLADEYYTSDVSYEGFYDLSVEPYEPNITTLVDFNSKWKDMLDKDTPIPTPANRNFIDVLGVFEGGGYLAKGIYRPKQDCMMKSFSTNKFCPVCQRAILKMIQFYSE